MKTSTLFLTLTAIVCFCMSVNAQPPYPDKIPAPRSAPSDKAKYRLTFDFTTRDIASGIILSRSIYMGDLMQLTADDPAHNLPFQGTLQLQNVSVTEISDRRHNRREWKELEGMEFEIEGDNFTQLDFYKGLPHAPLEIVRTFIQDKTAFDIYGKMYLDSLKLNVPFYPSFFQDQNAEFEKSVNFNTLKLSITWLGFSKMNNKDCILISYKSLYSPFNVITDTYFSDGRSCFWGHIWISVDTREVEYGTMNEDIVMNTEYNGYEELPSNKQRELTYRRIQ